MPAEEMGKLPAKLRLAFALCTVVCVIVLAISPGKDFRAEWKQYERSFVRFAKTRPDSKKLLADYSPGIDQVWLPGMNVTDRCTTCHQGIAKPSLADASVPQPFRAHPPVYHNVREWGCTICHRGQGLATEVAEAHGMTRDWEKPILPAHFLQASCGSCHQDDLKEAPQLTRGRELLAHLNCQACHKLNNPDAPETGPDLSSVGYKVSRQWIYMWLKQQHSSAAGEVKVTTNRFETGNGMRMPKFPLEEDEIKALAAFLSLQKARPIETYKMNPAIVARWSKNADLLHEGEVTFGKMRCITCHSLAVKHAGESGMAGGEIGPELTNVGSKVNKEWLVAWLRNPQSYLPNTNMPRFEWNDEELYKVSQYVMNELADSSQLGNVPQLGEATDEEVNKGRRLFKEKGCANCHGLTGSGAQKDFGPDLAAVGARNVSELEFGNAKIERNLVTYIQAKLQSPISVNPAARMPQFNWNQADLDAATTALLSQTGPAQTSDLQRLLVPRSGRSFEAVGTFAEVYERYKCSVCHRFNGHGGTLAPDLSYEGSRAQKKWIADFLKNPHTIRPTLILHMPQFNMPDKDAEIAAEFLSTTMQKPGWNPESVDSKQFNPAMISTGKQLYEVKYQCQSCHANGGTGSGVGPNLNNSGNWLTPAWIEAWLRSPQELQPDTIEPRRALSDEEIRALTAYLMTQRAGDNHQNDQNAANERVTSQGVGR